MKNLLIGLQLATIGMTAPGALAADDSRQPCPPLLDLSMRRLADDRIVNFCADYRGKVLLIVNTASKCGFTHQYEGLEALHAKYKDRGLVVLGFPSNDFANQEPGNEAEIATFCRLTYAVDFPMFEKISVKKGTAAPLFERLAAAGAPYPKWNFYKYLIDREGRLVDHFVSLTGPESDRLVRSIEKLL